MTANLGDLTNPLPDLANPPNSLHHSNTNYSTPIAHFKPGQVKFSLMYSNGRVGEMGVIQIEMVVIIADHHNGMHSISRPIGQLTCLHQHNDWQLLVKPPVQIRQVTFTVANLYP